LHCSVRAANNAALEQEVAEAEEVEVEGGVDDERVVDDVDGEVGGPSNATESKENEDSQRPLPSDSSTKDSGNNKKKKAKKKSSKKLMSYNHKVMGIRGLLRIQYSLQNTINPMMIQESFKLCGIRPFSLEQILSECTTKIDAEEEAVIRAALPTLGFDRMDHPKTNWC
jgi:hypothetical protein